MAITISAGNKGLPSNGYATGAILQTSFGFNAVTAQALFGYRSAYGHVPGKLQCSLTPQQVGNKVILETHVKWGGWYASDVAIGFRFYKRIAGGSWQTAGTYYSEPIPGTTGTHGVGTGEYIYRRDGGSSNSGSKSDEMMVMDTVTSTLPHEYAVFWGCLYESGGSRTIYWNRDNNYSNSYNPIHTCCIVATEIKG